MLDIRQDYSLSATPTPTPTTGTKVESLGTHHQLESPHKTMRKKNNNNNKKKKKKKRFSDEQIKSLETMFESESKLEPRMKLQLAKELGLQPRQVAIWFQNRRARWKSKQLERDYSVLKANYDDLASRYESLDNEKQSLIKELQKLSDLLGKPREESSCWRLGLGLGLGMGMGGNNSSTDGDYSDNGDTKYESDEKKPGLLLEGELDLRLDPCSDDEKSKNLEYFGDEEEAELMNIGEPTYEILASPKDWCSFDDSTGLFDQSCGSGSSQWWEFWP